jgi:hypothetical protein
MAPSRHNCRPGAMKPMLAPIAGPGPRPSRCRGAGSSDRSDRWPSRNLRQKSRSTRRRCKPNLRRCKAASCCSGLRPGAFGGEAFFDLAIDLGVALRFALLFLAGTEAENEGEGEEQRRQEKLFHDEDETELLLPYSNQKEGLGGRFAFVSAVVRRRSCGVVRRWSRSVVRRGLDRGGDGVFAGGSFPLPVAGEEGKNEEDRDHEFQAAGGRAAVRGRVSGRRGQIHRPTFSRAQEFSSPNDAIASITRRASRG